VRAKPRFYLRDLPVDLQDAMCDLHRRALAPLADNGKLGSVSSSSRTGSAEPAERRPPETVGRGLGYRVAVFRGGG
jgi:hypothetical protein